MNVPVLPAAVRDLFHAGPVPFADVMQHALYNPDHGYYGARPPRIGRGGDFYTAVSVGPLYGKLLALTAARCWRERDEPADFSLIEQGAHDGQLAADVLNGWPEPVRPRYQIIEPKPGYEAAQRATLAQVPGAAVSWHPALPDLSGPAFMLCNELLDAFPVHRVRWDGRSWKEVLVTPELTWVEGEPSADTVREEIALLPSDLPAGYTTEVHPAAVAWMRALSGSGFHGVLLIADYGYEAAEYYTPERADGTLRRYHDHRCDGEVLQALGECDLTAHVNFTRVIEVAQAGGFRVRQFMDQGRFLTHAAMDWLRTLEGRPLEPALARQFQSLTHPGHMGAAFRMLLLER